MHLGLYYQSSCHHLATSHLAQCLSLNFLCPPSDWTSYRERLYGSQTRWNLIQLFSKATLEMQEAKKVAVKTAFEISMWCHVSVPRTMVRIRWVTYNTKKFLGWYRRHKNIFDFSNFSHFCGFWGCRRIQTSLGTSSCYLDKLWLPMSMKGGFDFLVKWR